MEEKIEIEKKSPRRNGPKKRSKVVYPYELRLKRPVAGTSGNAIRLLSGLVTAQRPD